MEMISKFSILTVGFSSDKVFPVFEPSHADGIDDWRTIIFMELLIQLEWTKESK